MIARSSEGEILELLANFPAVALVGPRQSGKTTLARAMAESTEDEWLHLDLERPSDLNKLEHAEYFFSANRHRRIALDEVQRAPWLFPLLRAEIDADRRPGRFLLLGSASPQLMNSVAESLAGRVVYYELSPLTLAEVHETVGFEQHWLRGGFPEPLQKSSAKLAQQWHRAFIISFIERDLPMLGLNTHSVDLFRLFSMLTHEQGQPENNSKLAAALGVSAPAVKRALDFMEHSYLIRRLPPWHSNAKKRLVKSPRLYLRDTGILHAWLNLGSVADVLSHPIAGFSFEAYAIAQITAHPALRQHRFYYYRTQDGAECDLLAVQNEQVDYAFEFKLSSMPNLARGTHEAIADLKPRWFYVVTPNGGEYPIGVRAMHIDINELDARLRNG